VTCSRCSAEAVVKRGAATYCAKCALARDWEEIVMIVQEDRVEVAPSGVDFGDVPASEAPREEVAAEQPKPKVKAVAAKTDPDTNGERQADPFA
jgi:RNA polymerase subunit RPABC4/transcription elongation factor Spt4